ncbi:MAG: response regulator transcription factor [Candidatus Obscuribacterales bacterium]
MAKILLVEDDLNLSMTIKRWLVSEHHDVDTAKEGMDGLQKLRTYHYDATILDWDLPLLSGIDLLKQYRAEGGQTPVLMLTGKAMLDDKVKGFAVGADDYLTKPFEMLELIARLSALLKRPRRLEEPILRAGSLTLEVQSYKLLRDNQEIKLSPKEYRLIEFFMRNPDKVFSAEALLNRVWESASETSADTLRTFIKQLRQKLSPDGQFPCIVNVRGLGYKLQTQDLSS